MRILEVNKFFYLRRGAERHFLDLIALLESRGHEVGIFSMRHPRNLPSRWEKYFVSFVGYQKGEGNLWQKIVGSGRIFWSFEARRKIQKLLAEWRPDIVHLHNVYHQLSPSILGPIKALGLPIVMTVHDYNLVSPDKDEYYPAVGKRYWKFLFIRKYGLAKRLLLILKKYWEDDFDFYEEAINLYFAPSEYVKRVLVAAGMDREKIVVLPHFAGETSVPEEPQSLPELPQVFALYGGGLNREKGILDLFRLWKDIPVPLVLAGEPEPGLTVPEDSRFIRLGQLDKATYQALLSRAGCVVSPSRLPETFGLIALEATLAGKPFFGFASGALGEIIKNGKNGCLAQTEGEWQENIRRFFRGEIHLSGKRMRETAVARFSPTQYAEKLEHLFQSLVDSRLHRQRRDD